MEKNGSVRALLFVLTLLGLGLIIGAKPGDQARSQGMPSGVRSFVGLAGQTSTLLPDGKELLLGGQSDEGPVAFAALRDPLTGDVTPLRASLTQVRAWHTASVLPTGSVLIFGGVGTDGKVVTAAELFDPATQQFTSLPIVNVRARSHHTATLLTDGRVLFAGGEDSGGETLGSGQVWDPRGNVTADVAQDFITARSDSSARLQADGTILFWGGKDGSGLSLNSGEIYDPATQHFLLKTSAPAPYHGPVEIAETMPADGSKDIASDVLLAVRFATPVQMQSVNGSSVKLKSSDGAVPAKVVPAETGMLAFVSPAQSLASDTTYTVDLKGIIAVDGSSMPDFSFSFSTKAAGSSSKDGTGSAAGTNSASGQLPPLLAPPGVTAISGRVLLQNGQPLVHVTLRVGSHRTQTDKTGRFLLRDAPSGHQVLVVDGRTANTRIATYGVFEVGEDVRAGQTNILSFTIWMPIIDTAHAVGISVPTTQETVITTPLIPGLEFHLPAGTTITDIDGHAVHQVSITPVPINQPPFPLPAGVNVPVYFTIQPGGSDISVSNPKGPKGGWLVYPNTFHEAPGTRFDFWDYDADSKGWFVYGQGSVSANGQSIIPDPGVTIYELTGAMVATPYFTSKGPCNCSEESGDPVDLGTGLFVYRSVDLYEPDVIPIVLTREYHSGDSRIRDFGIGTQNSYDIYLVGDYYTYQYADLVLADGSEINYVRTSPGQSYLNAVFQPLFAPNRFAGSVIDPCWSLKQRDGLSYQFPCITNPPTYQQDGLASITDRHGNTLTITRDASYNISQITSPNGRWIRFTYDSSNRVTQVQDQLGRTVSYVYDSGGRLTQVTDANNGVWGYGYDSGNNMTSITNPRGITYLQNQYDGGSRIISQTHADGGTYHYTYSTTQSGNTVEADVTDPNGNLRKVTFNPPPNVAYSSTTDVTPATVTYASGSGQQQQFTNQYQAGTNLATSVTDQLGRKTTFTYDSLGNATSVTRLAGTSGAETTTFTYDPTYSQLTSITDPLQRLTAISLNSTGDPTSVTDPLGNMSLFTYDSEGRVLTATDPANDTTSFSYTGADLTSVTDPLNRTASFTRDGAGRLIGMASPLGHVVSYAYNPADQVTTIADPLGGTTSLAYDADRNLISMTEAQHPTSPTIYTYDSMDRLQSRTDPMNHGETYVYDVNGNVTQFTDRRGKITTYGYDALNRLLFTGFGTQAGPLYESTIGYTYDSADRVTQVVDSVAGTFNRSFDGLDRLTQEQGPEGTVSYAYDIVSRRTQATISGQSNPIMYVYDNDNHLTGMSQGNVNVSFTYDTAGRRTSLTLPNGIGVAYAYDQASELTGLTYSLAGTSLGGITYSYDQDSRRTQMGGSWGRIGIPSQTSSTAVYNLANQLSNWNGGTRTYDANGNLMNDGANGYTWDARNHLASISGAISASFVYDPFGRRLAKTVNGATTNFLYDGFNPVQELVGSTITANLLSDGIDELFQRVDSTGTSNFLQDGLGSTIAVANTSGTISSQYTYEPFGRTTLAGGSTSPYQYTGRENDSSGLYFYRARYYDPTTARFISEDPLRQSSGALNFYSYAADDPTNEIDPFGLAQCTYSVSMHTMICQPNADNFQPAIVGPNGLGAVQLGPDGVASGGSMQGPTSCTNNNKCFGQRFEGPIVPGTYKMNYDTRAEHQGMNVYRLQPWPHHWYDGTAYRMHLTRGGFELHLGTISLGCINADKKNPVAAQQYQQLNQLLQSENGSNYLTTIP